MKNRTFKIQNDSGAWWNGYCWGSIHGVKSYDSTMSVPFELPVDNSDNVFTSRVDNSWAIDSFDVSFECRDNPGFAKARVYCRDEYIS